MRHLSVTRTATAGVLLALSVGGVAAQMPDDAPCIPGETVLVSEGSAAAALAKPAGEVMVTMNGRDGLTIALSADQFAALPQYAIASENEHYDGLNCYQGPLGRDVVALILAEAGDMVTLTAINDYAVEAPVADYFAYDVIFATELNGVPFSVRDKGPIWVVYPQSDNKVLQDPIYSTLMAWQLTRVDLN